MTAKVPVKKCPHCGRSRPIYLIKSHMQQCDARDGYSVNGRGKFTLAEAIAKANEIATKTGVIVAVEERR